MNASTKLIILGATGVAACGAVLAVRHLRGKQFERNLDAVLTDLDDAELEEPVFVTEEVIVFTDMSPNDDDRATK